MKQLAVFFLLISLCIDTSAQSTNIPLNRDYYHLVDRYEIKSGKLSTIFFSGIKPYSRKEVAIFADSMFLSKSVELSNTDKYNLAYLANDNWEWATTANNDSKKPVWKKLYRKKSDFYHVQTEHFDLHLNPVLYLSGGVDKDEEAKPFINTRGVDIRGIIDKKIGFYAFLGENQAIFPEYARDWINDPIAERYSIPGEGFWKKYKANGVDFFTARGYISFNATKHINLKFGYDKNLEGNGYRSMILSDFANSYMFLKIKTQVWKFQYTNIFADMKAHVRASPGGSRSDTQYPNKFLAYHHLSLNIGKNLNVGVFEAISFGDNDTTRLHVPINLSYLNPIIFLRAIEQNEGSPHNAMVGMDFKWNFLNHFSAYGQLFLDEFKLANVTAGTGWWANKFGYQFGIKYIDVLNISNLDLQLEVNRARPYTYAHFTQRTNYSHYNLPLAHPLGANFSEAIGIVRYQPIHKLTLTGKIIAAKYGAEYNTTSNYGGNILKYNTKRFDKDGNPLGEYGHKTGQGVSTNLLFGDFTVSYQLKHNLFFDLKTIIRKLDSDIDTRDKNSMYTSLSIRLNIAQRELEF